MPNSMAPFSLLGSQGEQWTQDSAPGRSVAITARLQLVIPAKSGNPGTQTETVAPCSSQGQALGPRFRGGDDGVAVLAHGAGKCVRSSWPATLAGLASIRMKANTAGAVPLLTQ